MTERQRAVDLLRRIEREGLYAPLVLHDEPAFVRTLVLGVLRWRSRLDFVLNGLAKRTIDALVLDVLRVGAYQLLYMDVAPYAAVAETVSLAPKHARGFANAVLRKIAAGDAAQPRDVANRTAHPQWLLDRWSRTYGAARAEAIAEANQELSYPDVLALGEIAPPDAEPSALAPAMWRLHGSSAALDRRDFWPMDEGSAVIGAVAAAAGGRVLDLAAAPGGKSIYMRHRGAGVVSNDISVTRLLPLRGRGVPIVVSDGRRPAFRSSFETVLLDAPCSATGTIRKNPEIKWRLRESDLGGFVAMQRELLSAALTLTRSVCIYATCSLEPEENDGVVEATDAERIEITPFVPEGARRWVEGGVLRLTPESGTDGFTAFALRPRR